MKRVAILGISLCFLAARGGLPTAGAAQQAAPPLEPPAAAPQPMH